MSMYLGKSRAWTLNALPPHVPDGYTDDEIRTLRAELLEHQFTSPTKRKGRLIKECDSRLGDVITPSSRSPKSHKPAPIPKAAALLHWVNVVTGDLQEMKTYLDGPGPSYPEVLEALLDDARADVRSLTQQIADLVNKGDGFI